MEEKIEAAKIFYYINLIIRQRWLILISFCLAMIGGIYLSFVLPEIYEARTLILVEPQRVPDDYVKSIVSSDIQSRIATIKQQILSRTNLEKIIEDFDIFSGPEYQNKFMEEKIEILRDLIRVRVTKARQGFDTFSISFSGKDPETVMNVANALAFYVIEENLKIREAHAAGTSEFLDDELRVMRKRLEEVEDNLRNYRKQYMGELPEQLNSNLKIIGTLQLQLEERKERLRDERHRLNVVEGEIRDEKVLLAANAAPVDSVSGENITLDRLKAQLANLKSSYTDQHPDVIRLKKKISDFETQKKVEISSVSTTSPGGESGGQILTPLPRTLRDKMAQRTEIMAEINNLQEDIVEINQQINTYQQRVERTPKREEELISLNRDYENIKSSYNSLLNRKLEAEIAVNMEKKQKGEQFRIIDRARLPEKPISPDTKKLFLLSIVVGLGVGGGLVFLIDFLDTSYRRTEDIESVAGIKVLATIPQVLHLRDRVMHTFRLVLTLVFILVAAVLFGGFAVLAFKGFEPALEMIRIFARI